VVANISTAGGGESTKTKRNTASANIFVGIKIQTLKTFTHTHKKMNLSYATNMTYLLFLINMHIVVRGESNAKLPLRTCPECSVPEPYRSPDWALVPAKTGPRDEY
jgi:hypothetical protein